VCLDIGGTRINVTIAPAGQAFPQGTTDSHYGMEHSGFDTDGIERVMERLEAQGVEALLPVAVTVTGSRASSLSITRSMPSVSKPECSIP
jgi:hypothetical protein